ncbi:hypothetical protein ACXR2U_00540 [Jatrophihabitans sp. YIM 134969]
MEWTIHAAARAGEDVFFYVTGLKQILAHGTTQDDATDSGNERWGRWTTRIENVSLVQPFDLRTLRADFPDWGWART